MAKITGVERATGRDRDGWFNELDNWGAFGRPYREIFDWLTGEHGLSRWWAQKITVEYEQERGVRPAGVRRNGTFEVSASRTVGVPVEGAFDAFVNPRKRKKWLTDATMSLSDSRPARSARFLWDGSSRVTVSFLDKGSSKSTIVVSHDRIVGAEQAQIAKARWKERLAELKSYLET
jgi:uncharacterized protein YndB with AHSA1/START domain